MATPLYKSMKSRGTSFYAFPSAAEDMNLAFSNNNYKINFTKFVLLNIPEQEIVISTGVDRDQTKGVMNFDKDENGPRFFNFQPGANNDLPITFAEQLVESLRNYVANYNSTLRESRINSNTDFYNINEKVTPTEMIFWKWCKKLNLLDLEPALHKIDWDKNLADFNNPNGVNYDYFQKYLWKERDVNYYACSLTQYTGNYPIVTITGNAKFKTGDYIYLSGSTGSLSSETVAYEVTNVIYTTADTSLILNVSSYIDSSVYNCVVYLKYNRLVEYIGEIQAISQIQTSKRNFTEVTVQIPHHVGRTPTVLFYIETNTNYYPGLEMPILPIEQQEEIIGAENTNSPIRLRPQDYPGTYFGYFDTENKTYKCESGDKLRYKGDYYGIKLTNNIGVDAEDYFEKLRDFNSDNIDGLKIDLNREHYLKMNLPDYQISNFDEFNAANFDGAPEDFYFNAILWYYEVDDGSGNIVNNLYGIEFLNNPNDDDDECDINYRRITPYRKLVSNGNQDGVSYTFSLNINFNIDNDVLPLSYDPTTIYNMFGFDLYQNILNTNAKLQENFTYMISSFTWMNEELFEVKSLIYSQTDIDTIKSQIENLNNLLELYSTFQFKDSDTTTIETDFSGSYPTLKVNVINTKYSDIQDVNISNVLDYNITNSGLSYIIPVPLSNQLLLNIYNDNNIIEDTATILLNRDMAYKQSMDIYIMPNMSELPETLKINIMYNDGLGTITEQTLLSGITLPVDLYDYNSLNPTASTYMNSYYTNNNIFTYGQTITTGLTNLKIYLMDDLFDVGDYVYIDNFYLQSGNTITDFTGVYYISGHTTGDTWGNGSDITINLPSANWSLKSKPKISYYKGLKINILRVSSSTTSTLVDRYKITKELL
mgnify:CR=1 FL=1